MKSKYEYRKKALDFARKQGYDSLTVVGYYENYEVYSPYCKSWKENPPVIGLPQLILINDKEVKWNDSDDPFSIIDACVPPKLNLDFFAKANKVVKTYSAFSC